MKVITYSAVDISPSWRVPPDIVSLPWDERTADIAAKSSHPSAKQSAAVM